MTTTVNDVANIAQTLRQYLRTMASNDKAADSGLWQDLADRLDPEITEWADWQEVWHERQAGNP